MFLALNCKIESDEMNTNEPDEKSLKIKERGVMNKYLINLLMQLKFYSNLPMYSSIHFSCSIYFYI
jgi:hypothetical protein